MHQPGWLCPPRRGLSAALPALLSAVLLVACGSDDSKESAAVRKDITQALTTTDKDKFCKPNTYATQRWVDQQNFGISGIAKEIRKVCRRDFKANVADSVKVSKVNVDGERATARFTAKGGGAGFGDLEVALVKDGRWKFDELTAADIDRAKFNKLQIRAASSGAASSGGKLSKAQTGCLLRRLDRLSDAELERALVKADIKLAVDPVLVCILRPWVRKDLSLTQTSCVLKALRSQGEKVARVFIKEDESGFEELFGQAAAGCRG